MFRLLRQVIRHKDRPSAADRGAKIRPASTLAVPSAEGSGPDQQHPILFARAVEFEEPLDSAPISTTKFAKLKLVI